MVWLEKFLQNLLEIFCWHEWSRITILTGCRKRLDCRKCGRAGETQEDHSWTQWERVLQPRAAYRAGIKIKNSEFIANLQTRKCVRCNFYIEREV
jgi:hypothetical protein